MAISEDQRLVVAVEAQTKQFENAIKKLEGQIDRSFKSSSKTADTLGARLNKLEGTFKSIATQFGAGFLIGGLTTLPAVLQQVTSELDKIGKTADKVGLTTSQLQELRFAADLTGVSSNNLDVAMQRFSRRVAEAADGTGVLKDVFKLNNVQLRDAEGRVRPLNDLFREYADLVSNAGSEQEALRLAFLAFDSEGAALVNTLRGGSAELDRLVKIGTDAGVVIGEDMVRASEDLNDKFTILSTTIRSKVKKEIVELAIEMDKIAQRFQDLLSSPNLLNLQRLTGISVKGRNAAEVSIADQLGLGQTNPDFSGFENLLNGNPSATAKTKPPRTKPATILPGEATAAADAAAKKQQKSIKDTIEQLQFEAEQLGRTNEQQELYNNLKRAGATLESEAGEKIAEATSKLQGMRESIDATRQATVALGQTAFDAIDGMIFGGQKAKDAMLDLARAIGKAALQATLLGEGPLAGVFGTKSKSGGLGGLFGLLTSFLPKFHVGGRVPGSPSQEVPILARGGELVSQPGSASNGSIMNITVNAPGASAEAMALAFREIDALKQQQRDMPNYISQVQTQRPSLGVF